MSINGFNQVDGSSPVKEPFSAKEMGATDPTKNKTSVEGQRALRAANPKSPPTSLPEGLIANAQSIANRLATVTKLINETNANEALNVIARWRGDKFELKTLDAGSNKFSQISFKLLKIFMHDKSWKEKVINDLEYLSNNIPESSGKKKILESAFKAAHSILQTGSYYGTPSSISADRRLRILYNALNPPVVSNGGLNTVQSIAEARKLAHQAENADEIDFSHAAGMTIATSVGGNLGRGGLGCWTSAQEVAGLRELMKDKPELNTDVKMSSYIAAAEKSLPLNVRLQLAQINSINKNPSYFTTLAADYKKAIDDLKNGKDDFVFMDCNFKGHCMRAVFSKDDMGFVRAQLFDTSGELEAREGNFITGNLRAFLGSKQKVCLEIQILPEKFEKGQAWLEQVMGVDSKDTHQKMEHQMLTSEEISASFRRVFTSISSTGDVVSLAPVQTMGNCYAKRLEAAQLELLGPKKYLELRLKQYSILENEINQKLDIVLLEERAPKKLDRFEYLKVRNELRTLSKREPLKSVRNHQ
jgi:hypothetical protein